MIIGIGLSKMLARVKSKKTKMSSLVKFVEEQFVEKKELENL